MRIRLAGCWVPDFAVANDSGTRRVAELARDGRPLLIDLTDRGEVAAALVDKDDRLTIAAGRAAGNAPAATSLLVGPDGYVVWASSHARPDQDDVGELRRVLTRWFGI
jgi:hypothetical protein